MEEKMKNVVVFVIILIVAAVAFLMLTGDDESTVTAPGQAFLNRNVEPIEITGTKEEKARIVAQYTARSKSEMRSIATAVESYFVDWNTYPPDLTVTTTPIAYMTKMFKDPFTKDTEYGYRLDDQKGWIVWSIGPDGEDDFGEKGYDPGRGTFSVGDIVRTRM
jgi:hypothetical protein